MRAGRRRPQRRGISLPALFGLLAVLVLLGGGLYWFTRPTESSGPNGNAVVAPGGFRASIGNNNTITVGLEIRNTADTPVTIVAARIVAPPGLTSIAVTMLPTDEENAGFALEGEIPPP